MFEPHGRPLPPSPRSGPRTAAELEAFDPVASDDDALLDTAVEAYRHVAWTQAVMFAALAELHRRFREEQPVRGSREPMLDVAAELSPAAAVAPGTAIRLVDLAISLAERLPRSLEAMRQGGMDALKAQVLVEVTDQLDPASRHEVEQVALDHAPTKSARQLRRKLNDAAVRVDPAAAERRREAACRRRRVDHWADPDGQAILNVRGPAEQTAAIYSILDKVARRKRPDGDTRTIDERRFDALYDIVLGRSKGTVGEVQIVVAADTLLGRDDRPALLRGYGAITSEAARAIAKDARWRRLLTDPMDGSLLDVGTRTYRPPKHLERFIKTRDLTCIEPMCDCDSRSTQCDHTQNFPDGPTAEGNLGALCTSRGHPSKTRGSATVEQVEPGVFWWTTRLGRTYEVDRRPLLGLTGPDDGSVDPGDDKPRVVRDLPPPF